MRAMSEVCARAMTPDCFMHAAFLLRDKPFQCDVALCALCALCAICLHSCSSFVFFYIAEYVTVRM
eukprot:m.183972 g.183972  ORF g.183972 m.183972 type:complete len:66 (+) comp10498_c0_seq12:959-1156(+)